MSSKRSVYVLGSRLSSGSPEHVVLDDNPSRLLERIRDENHGGDVHLVGGPKTIEAFRKLGALNELHLMVLSIFTRAGRQLTPDLGVDTSLTLADTRPWPGGVTELTYVVGSPH